MSILVTGFEPFGGDSFNPSQAVLAPLKEYCQQQGIDGVFAVLPVDSATVQDVLYGLLETVRPSLYLGLGLAAGRSALSVERIGVNLWDFSLPDNGGVRREAVPIVENAPAAYFSTLPVQRMVRQCADRKIPFYISPSAGTYLCNAALYLSLHWAKEKGEAGMPAGFIHMPWSTDFVPRPGRNTALPLEFMAGGIAVALGAALTS